MSLAAVAVGGRLGAPVALAASPLLPGTTCVVLESSHIREMGWQLSDFTIRWHHYHGGQNDYQPNGFPAGINFGNGITNRNPSELLLVMAFW